MAGLNKENTNPVTYTITAKKPKQNRLKANRNGPPFKPKDNIKPNENDQIQVIKIKDNTDQKTTVGQDSLLTESDVANTIYDLMNGQQLASDLDDIDYTTTGGLFKRKGDNSTCTTTTAENHHDEPPPKKRGTLFQRVHNFVHNFVNDIDEVTNITSCNTREQSG